MQRSTFVLGLFLLACTLGAGAQAGAQEADRLVVAPAEVLDVDAPAGARVEAAYDGGVLRPLHGPLKAPGDGEHWLAVVARSGAGAVSQVHWVRVLVDGRKPKCRLSFAPEPVKGSNGIRWVRQGTTVELEAKDELAGVASVELVQHGTTAATGVASVQVTLEREGPVAVEGRCVDSVGNRAVTQAIGLNVDGTPPAGELTLDGTWISREGRIIAAPETSVRASWSDGMSGVASTWIAGDGRWEDGSSLPGGWPEGAHVAKARARDRAGNESAVASLDFTVDGTPPVVDCRVDGLTGTDRWVPQGSVASCRADDAVAGVESLEYSTEGHVWYAAGAEIPLTPAGVRVRARDRVGNVREIVLDYRVDTKAPEIALAGPRGVKGGGLVETVIRRGETLSIDARDGESGVAQVEYRVGRGPWSPVHGPVTFRDGGSFVLEVRATDRAGNRALRSWAIRVVPGADGGR